MTAKWGFRGEIVRGFTDIVAFTLDGRTDSERDWWIMIFNIYIYINTHKRQSRKLESATTAREYKKEKKTKKYGNN